MKLFREITCGKILSGLSFNSSHHDHFHGQVQALGHCTVKQLTFCLPMSPFRANVWVSMKDLPVHLRTLFPILQQPPSSFIKAVLYGRAEHRLLALMTCPYSFNVLFLTLVIRSSYETLSCLLVPRAVSFFVMWSR